MRKVKYSNHTNTVLILVNTLIGIALWILIAAIMSWLILSEKIGEPAAIFIGPLAQGCIAYVITSISLFGGRGGKATALLLAPFGYLILQFVVSLLFWEPNLNGIIRGALAVICGAALSFLTYKLKHKNRKPKTFLRYSR